MGATRWEPTGEPGPGPVQREGDGGVAGDVEGQGEAGDAAVAATDGEGLVLGRLQLLEQGRGLAVVGVSKRSWSSNHDATRTTQACCSSWAFTQSVAVIVRPSSADCQL